MFFLNLATKKNNSHEIKLGTSKEDSRPITSTSRTQSKNKKKTTYLHPKTIEIVKIKDILVKKLQTMGQMILNKKNIRQVEGIQKKKKKKKKNRNLIWITFFVFKFIKILKTTISIKKYKKLTSRHFGLLGDRTKWIQKSFKIKSRFSSQNTNFFFNKKKLLKKIKDYIIVKFFDIISDTLNCFQQILSQIPILEPDRPGRFAFDFLMLVYLLTLIGNIILKYGFSLTEDNYYYVIWILFERVPSWLFLFEAILSLNTSYYSRGMYISNRKKIFHHYLKNNLLIDLLTIFPLFLYGTVYASYMQIFVVLRVKNVNGLVKRLEDYLHLKGKNEGVFQLIKLIINLLFLAHISACSWHLMGAWEIQAGVSDNWLAVADIQTDVWYIRYVYSFYFSIVTMMTVGYGDIRPNNYYECSFDIFFIIYGCGVFAYSINNIGNIFKEMYQEDKEFKKKIKILSDYMNKRKMSKFLQIKIKKYLEYMYEESKMNYKDSLFLTQTLSQSLKEECYHELYGKLLRNNIIFSQFSEQFLDKLTHYFQEMTFAPDDLVKIQEENESIIYFILKGEINVGYNNLKVFHFFSKLIFKKTGETFGEICFITGESKVNYAKSLAVTHTAFLKRGDFIKLIRHFREDYEKFCDLKDQIFVNQNMHLLKLKCFSCCSNSHLVKNCPLIHYIPYKIGIIKRYTASEDHVKRRPKERLNKKDNFKKHLDEIQSKALEYMKCNNNDDLKTLRDSESSLEIESEINIAEFGSKSLNSTFQRLNTISGGKSDIKEIEKKNDFVNINEEEEKTNSNETLKEHLPINTPKIDKEILESHHQTPLKKIRAFSENEDYLVRNPLPKKRNSRQTTPRDFVRFKHQSFEEEDLKSIADSESSLKRLVRGRTLLTDEKKQNSQVVRLPTSEEIKKQSPFFRENSQEYKKQNTYLRENTQDSAFHVNRDFHIKQSSIQTQENREQHHNESLFRETIENFDKIKIFKFYLTHNNIDTIIKKMKGKKRSKYRKSSAISPVSSAKSKLGQAKEKKIKL